MSLECVLALAHFWFYPLYVFSLFLAYTCRFLFWVSYHALRILPIKPCHKLGLLVTSVVNLFTIIVHKRIYVNTKIVKETKSPSFPKGLQTSFLFGLVYPNLRDVP